MSRAENISEASAVIAGIATEVGRLSVDIADVTGNIEEVRALADDQARNFVQISEGTRETADSNRRIAEVAAQTQTVAAHAHHSVVAANQEIHNSLGAIQSLVTSVSSIGAQLASLDAAMRRVSSVTGAIDRIARQTNLLALNATIEAARSGEAGRGFAVVAGEVKALARETTGATAEIAAVLAELTQQVRSLSEHSADGSRHAEAVGRSTQTIGSAMSTVGEAVAQVDDNAQRIAGATEDISQRCGQLEGVVSAMSIGVAKSTDALAQAAERSQRVLSGSEAILQMTASSGFETADSKFIEAAVDVARKIEIRLKQALDSGELTMADLFDKHLAPIAGTNPVQYMTRYIPFLDREIQPLADPLLDLDERMVFCAPIDHNRLIPCHNPQFRKPQGKDPVWNAANCRNRRQFLDKTAAAIVVSTQPFLLQTYRRDMGGGVFALMKDASAPIRVNGQHWGGIRVCYRA
jgi:methyl-accepting chemotaxis protein